MNTGIQMNKPRRHFRKFLPFYVMMLPGMLYLLINNYLPMFGLVMAFKDINFAKGILGSDWIGFKNFEYLFKSTDALIITRNTILYNMAFIAINTIVAIFFAILLNEIRRKFFMRLYQSLILLPHLISMVIVSYLVFAFLSTDSGFLNKTVLPFLGIGEVSWYAEPKFWPYILTMVNTWK
jgi:putative aldouronate transport system permease protein